MRLALICQNFDNIANFDNFEVFGNFDNFRVNTGSGINFTLRTSNFSDQTFCGVELTRTLIYLRFGMMDVS